MERKSAIKQRAPSDTAADNKQAQPATALRCKHCNCGFATVSAEGDLNPTMPREQACASCEPFLGLYDTLRTGEQEHTALLDRGPKHHGRIMAHEQFRKARVALENFLVNIEAPNDVSFDITQAGFANHTAPVSLKCAQEPEEGPKHPDDQNNLQGASPPVDCVSSTAPLPTIKRKLARKSSASTLGRKRIRFCEDVEERPEYRETLEYYRGAKEYVPGRYAVTEGSEYEDTSGSTISFAKFTGQKKVGIKFVDIVPKRKTQDGEEGISVVQGKGNDGSKKMLGLPEKPDAPEKDETQMNSRELRLSRRARSTTPPAEVRPRRISAQYDGQEVRFPEGSNDAPSLVVALKGSSLFETHALPNGDQSAPVLEDTRGTERVIRSADLNKTALKAIEPAAIGQVVSNIRRELRYLQQTTVTPKYQDMVSEAVHGCYEALKPLQHLDCVRSLHFDIVESLQEEEDSIYFEAFDGTGEPTLIAVPEPPPNPDKVFPTWSEVIAHNKSSRKSDTSLAPDANLPIDMPKGNKQNSHEISDLERSDNDNGTNTRLPTLSTDAVEKRANQTETEGVTRVGSQDEHLDGHFTRPAAAA
ncbi:uncharacterized protein M421DRAFT_88139 [Didymella exigua CBS 183.55]|uniref:Uncharacterized protein n=1 Tax=Didymella exigua CBS 183.55 TaxID=1150837 RepID=A0A6A5S6K3_9PLEO|nr:uncharacterized protein M421DRAFT_88139 [Didymella exigua CBS 183.55]KAF1934116.1 hypothetical protein M421DRAFT_88139 [Didymella exigua CBS 183.55]